MRTLIIGDVHGCSAELQTMILQVQASNIILVGDLFTKGPDPIGVWELIQHYHIQSTLGNHDVAICTTRPKKLPFEAYQYIETLPLTIELENCIVVHAGFHPFEKTTKQQAITIRRVPNDLNDKNPFWWELITTKKLIVYGHDAKRGLQDHRPHTLGLDTGCVYGGHLTGYLVEEDRLISIPARQCYCPIQKPTQEKK